MSTDEYVRMDSDGVLRIGSTRVMLDSVLASFEKGHSAEAILQQYPALTLEEVYGAITYYLSHREDVNEYLQNQGEVWDRWRANAAQRRSAVAERLRALPNADVPDGS